ncbi:beta-lactamase family protein [Hypoxylon crocopeplum]|nr:beta-lactamase family protein [Hypoxylon crocopeplum]
MASQVISPTQVNRSTVRSNLKALSFICVKMSTFSHEPAFEAACQSGRIPGAVLVATDATGKFKYAKAFGKTAHGETLSIDSVFWIASCTKLMVSVAALQQVERGHIGLDEDIEKVLPEVTALQVLTGFDDEEKPVYEERQGTITLRHLLTHTTGLSIPIFTPELQQLQKFKGPPATPPKTIEAEFSEPLLFQPGKGWNYGTGYDWAGKMVERFSGLTLEEYMRANVWGPLNMRHMSFSPDSSPEMKERKINMSLKDESGKLVPTTEGYIYLYEDRDDAYGGFAGWGSAESFLQLLQTLCANDGRVLSKELVDEMFRPQLGPETKEGLNHLLKNVDLLRRVYANSFDMDHQVMDHGLGGEIGTRDEVGRRKAGTMSWGGLPNLIWWIDREAGLCGALFTNVVPLGDAEVSKLEGLFEKAVYEQYEEFKKQ